MDHAFDVKDECAPTLVTGNLFLPGLLTQACSPANIEDKKGGSNSRPVTFCCHDKHHDQDNLGKRGFILAYGYRGRVHDGGGVTVADNLKHKTGWSHSLIREHETESVN